MWDVFSADMSKNRITGSCHTNFCFIASHFITHLWKKLLNKENWHSMNFKKHFYFNCFLLFFSSFKECFLAGECKDSFFITGEQKPDEFACLNFCKSGNFGWYFLGRERSAEFFLTEILHRNLFHQKGRSTESCCG